MGMDRLGFWLPECAYRPRYEWVPPLADLATLQQRADAVRSFKPTDMTEMADFVAGVKAKGGDLPRSGHATCSWPRERWAVMAELAAVHDALREMSNKLAEWQIDEQVRAPAPKGWARARIPCACAGL